MDNVKTIATHLQAYLSFHVGQNDLSKLNNMKLVYFIDITITKCKDNQGCVTNFQIKLKFKSVYCYTYQLVQENTSIMLQNTFLNQPQITSMYNNLFCLINWIILNISRRAKKINVLNVLTKAWKILFSLALFQTMAWCMCQNITLPCVDLFEECVGECRCSMRT